MSAYLVNYIVSLWVTFAATLGMAWFVAVKGWEVRANRRFVFFNLSVAWWSLWQGLLPLASSQEMASWIGKIEHASVVYISTVFLHFVYELLEVRERFWLRIHYRLSFIFLLLLPTGLLVSGADSGHRYLPYMIEPGPLYGAMTVWFLAQSTQGVFLLLRAYAGSTGAARNRLKYLAWGAFIGYVGGCGNYLYVFDWDIPIFNPFGSYGVPVYVFMTAYAIIQHRMLDINVVLRRTLIYTLLYSLCLGIFGFVVFFLGQWVVLGGINPRLVLLSMLGLLLVVASVRPLDQFLTRVTEKVLFHRKYGYQQTLRAASAGMGRVRSLPKLLALITRVVVRRVQVTHAAVYLKERNSSRFRVAASSGRPRDPVATGLWLDGEENPLTQWLARHREPLVCDELKLELKRAQQAGESILAGRLSPVVAEMSRLQASVCVPSFMGGRLKGILMLGDKLSGDMYNQEDLDIFATLANQAALAIENAESYEELRDTRDQLLQSERLATIGRFASDMAHEIKNPLQAIMTFFDFLPERYNDPDFRERFARVAKAEAQRIDRLVRELVTYTHPKPPALRPVEIHQVLDSVLDLLESDLYRSDIDVRKLYHPRELLIEADRDQMKQVFLNLFMNAIEAMPPSPVRGHSLEITTVPGVQSVSLTVRDSGCGISPQQVPFLFTPFFTTKEKGSGLGLAIVQNILRAHHADVTMQSRPGQGTTVMLTLPMRQPAGAARAA